MEPETAAAMNNLAIALQLIGSEEQAEDLLIRALFIKENAKGPDHSDTALALNNLAMLYTKIGSYNKAAPLYKRAFTIAKKSLAPKHPDFATYLTNLALNHKRQGLYSQSSELLERALIIDKEKLGVNHLDTATSFNNLASSYISQKIPKKAKLNYRSGMTASLNISQRELPFLSIRDRNNFKIVLNQGWESIFAAADKNKIYADLALFWRLNHQGLLQEIEKRQSRLSKASGSELLIIKELEGLITKKPFDNSQDVNHKNLISQKENLEKKLYRMLPELKPKITEIDQVAKTIPDNGLLVEFKRFYEYDNKNDKWNLQSSKYMALVLSSHGEVDVFDLGSTTVIEQTIEAALKATSRNLADQQKLWDEVSQLVIDPLAKQLEGKDQIFISPDGELNRVPFAALRSPQNRQFLGEDKQLRLLSTGRELLELSND